MICVILDCKKKFSYACGSLLHLNVALNLDCPEHNLGTGWNLESMSQWGKCPSFINNISEETMQYIYNSTLQDEPNRRSQFQSNVARVMRYILGSSAYIHHECLSLSGYSYDFQLLFNERKVPIQIPLKWRLRSRSIAARSIGLVPENSSPKVYYARENGVSLIV